VDENELTNGFKIESVARVQKPIYPNIKYHDALKKSINLTKKWLKKMNKKKMFT